MSRRTHKASLALRLLVSRTDGEAVPLPDQSACVFVEPVIRYDFDLKGNVPQTAETEQIMGIGLKGDVPAGSVPLPARTAFD